MSADQGGIVDTNDAGQPSRKAARRGGLIPPYVEGAPIITPIPPAGSGYQSGGSTSTGKSDQGGGVQGAGTGVNTQKIRVKAGSAVPADSTGTTDAKVKPSKKANRRGGTPP